MKIPVILVNLIPAKHLARFAYDIIAGSYVLFLVLHTEECYEEHIDHSLPIK